MEYCIEGMGFMLGKLLIANYYEQMLDINL